MFFSSLLVQYKKVYLENELIKFLINGTCKDKGPLGQRERILERVNQINQLVFIFTS
jgi:hypothetical protein